MNEDAILKDMDNQALNNMNTGDYSAQNDLKRQLRSTFKPLPRLSYDIFKGVVMFGSSEEILKIDLNHGIMCGGFLRKNSNL